MAALQQAPAPAAAAAVVDQLPERSLALADLAAEIATQAVDHYRGRGLAAARPDAFLPDLAGSLNNQSNRLADLGRREDALTAIGEAVQIRRGLAEKHPVFLDLAMSLTSLGIRLTELGSPELALAADREACRCT